MWKSAVKMSLTKWSTVFQSVCPWAEFRKHVLLTWWERLAIPGKQDNHNFGRFVWHSVRCASLKGHIPLQEGHTGPRSCSSVRCCSSSTNSRSPPNPTGQRWLSLHILIVLQTFFFFSKILLWKQQKYSWNKTLMCIHQKTSDYLTHSHHLSFLAMSRRGESYICWPSIREAWEPFVSNMLLVDR